MPFQWHVHCMGILEGSIKEREWRGQTRGGRNPAHPSWASQTGWTIGEQGEAG